MLKTGWDLAADGSKNGWILAALRLLVNREIRKETEFHPKKASRVGSSCYSELSKIFTKSTCKNELTKL